MIVGLYCDEHQGYVGVLPEGLPSLLEQPRDPGSEVVQLVATYLAGGRRVAATLGWGIDIIDPALRTDLDDYTDGEWVWPGHALHYCTTYGIVPPETAFLAAIGARNGICPLVTDEQLLNIEAATYPAVSSATVDWARMEDEAGPATGTDPVLISVAVDDFDTGVTSHVDAAERDLLTRSIEILDSIVQPAVSLGKDADYFRRRDEAEQRSGPDSLTAVHHMFFSPETAIRATPDANGRWRTSRDDTRVRIAHELKVRTLPVIAE